MKVIDRIELRRRKESMVVADEVKVVVARLWSSHFVHHSYQRCWYC